ncbi:MAG: hypothetical protein A3J27_02570 [Candidatus Tectomicrobia bacterium RIFCSPLOWO2_12_FULL_69_37]|nr:MAG: hypothetical protein A3J27_02570 [Candidatus Tectomicrobia bacterium RIFCSPLOWO2_12_FULL_69_37]
MTRRSPGVALPLLISLLLHLLAFGVVSLEMLWPVRVAASRPPVFRVVSVELPKPAEELPENPESRLLADANRPLSGQEKPGPKPQLREEREEKVPARQGLPQEQVASLPPAPPSPPAPPVPRVEAAPPAPREEVKKPEPEKKPPQVVPPPSPRPAPRQEQARVEVTKKEEPKREPPKPPQQARPPAPPQDPLAPFRAQPRGRPNAPNLNLSDEDADRIARASLEKDLKKEEVGDAISLDTRDFRFASYFAHIKERIQNNWSWPREARDYAGKLVLRFVLSEDGGLRKVELLSSSGYRILDDEAMSALTKAAPFRPFPPGMGRKFLNIEGTFVYEHAGRRMVP